ncbi:hypothetical protein ACFQV2_26800 [Actinokineospora soli]|uniref:Uncharacterized protein n=1 Tax=Actinokineospora soli TaxID=1048753 RepID=A0ABW2TRV6_9PSEU
MHSALCDTDRTLTTLRDHGLKAAVVARARDPFGPVMHSRAHSMVAAGLLAPDDIDEELVVIRADLLVG